MKVSKSKLMDMITEILNEQRDEPGLSHARSNLAYGHPEGGSKALQKNFNKASRRQGSRDIRWALMDADSDGDLDLVNLGSTDPLAAKPEIRDILVAAGVLSAEDRDSMREPESFADPKFGTKDRPGKADNFLANLAWNIADGTEQRLSDEAIQSLQRLDPEFKSALQIAVDEIMDQDRRDEDYYDNDYINESKEKKMSKGFSRSDIKNWFAQTLYEDFETSKPRKRRSSGILTEATSDDRKAAEPWDLDKLKNVLVAGTLATHGIEIDQENKEAKALKAEFDNIIVAALEKYPDCVAMLSDHIGAFVRDAQSELDDGMGPPDEAGADRADMVDMVASVVYDAMDSSSFSADVLRDLIDDMSDRGDIDRQMWDASDIEYEDVLKAVKKKEEENVEFTGL